MSHDLTYSRQVVRRDESDVRELTGRRSNHPLEGSFVVIAKEKK